MSISGLPLCLNMAGKYVFAGPLKIQTAITSQVIKHKGLAVELKHLVHFSDSRGYGIAIRGQQWVMMIWPSLRSGDNHTGASRQEHRGDNW